MLGLSPTLRSFLALASLGRRGCGWTVHDTVALLLRPVVEVHRPTTQTKS